jgi:RNA polymerase sigma-70 factor (family 1)
MSLPEQDQHIENELLLQVSAGDEQAFSKLFHQHHQHLAAYVYKLTNSRELAEEVVQDVFIRVWDCRLTLKEVKNFRAWLYVISKNYTLNCLRRIVKEKLMQKEWVNQQSTLAATEISLANFDSEREALEYNEALVAISQLPPQQQKVYILRRLKNMKYREIAQQLSVSRETVKSYLKLANSSIAKFAGSRGSTLEFWVLIILALHL